MLLGSYSAKLDEKGRLAVPKRFRNELGTKLIVGRWYEGCLLIVHPITWSEMVSRLTGGELASLSARDTDRFLLAGSFEIELDAQGRFIIPHLMRSYAHITDEVIVAGLGNRIEVWAKDAWYEREKMVIEKAGEKVELLYQERKKV